VSRGTLDNPAADVLRVLAVSRSTGALEIRGVPAGTIFLDEGDVTYAEAPGTPAVPEPSAGPGADPGPAFGDAVRAAVVETGLLLLTAPPVRGERPLFRPGRRHWTGTACRLGVDTVLTEVERRAARLADLGVPPDAEIRLRGLRRGRRVVLTADEWRVVAALDGVQTPRALAWRSGTSLTAAVRAVASLVRAGVCQADAAAPAAPAAVVPPPAAPQVEPAPVLAPPSLPRRTRAGTVLPPAPSPSPPAEMTAAAMDGWAAPGSLADRVEIAERVLAGLRRL
jgi:hypothetical protein